jgi:hypothetical protein
MLTYITRSPPLLFVVTVVSQIDVTGHAAAAPPSTTTSGRAVHLTYDLRFISQPLHVFAYPFRASSAQFVHQTRNRSLWCSRRFVVCLCRCWCGRRGVHGSSRISKQATQTDQHHAGSAGAHLAAAGRTKLVFVEIRFSSSSRLAAVQCRSMRLDAFFDELLLHERRHRAVHEELHGEAAGAGRT